LAKFVNYLTRTIVTVHGEIDVHRAYYYCKHCPQSSMPWDDDVGLDQGLSHGVRTLVGADGEVHHWDLAASTELRKLEGHRDQVWSAAFSRDGRLALSCGQDSSVRVWGGSH
jgi:WD40 repeat protein